MQAKFQFVWLLFVYLVGVVIPNVHIVVYQILYVWLAREKPVQLVEDPIPIHTLRGQHGKVFWQVKANLAAKHAVGSNTRTFVGLRLTCQGVAK